VSDLGFHHTLPHGALHPILMTQQQQQQQQQQQADLLESMDGQ
jgi:hypothetical protein